MSEPSLDQRLLAGIGGVVRDSGHASMALQQMVETVTGTGLLNFLLRDDTLGSQQKAATTMLNKVGTNRWIQHPPVDDEVRDEILVILSELSYLIGLRNRIVHDVWMTAETPEQPEGIYSIGATRWGKYNIESNVGSLRQIARAFFSTAVALQEADRAILSLRQADETGWTALRDDALRSMRSDHSDLTRQIDGMKAKTLEGWRWNVHTPNFLPGE